MGQAVQHPAARTSLSDVQALRGIAALLVMCYHTGPIYATHFNALLFGNAFRAGFLGVDFFFVLSGFVMYWAHAQDFGRPAALGSFVKKRLLRIMPLYWVVLALKLLRDWRHFDWVVALSAATLLPFPRPPYITVSWTLSYEMLFYAAVAVMILLPRGWLTFVPLLVLAALALTPAPELAPGAGFLETLMVFPFNIHLLEFLMGLAVGWLNAHWVLSRRQVDAVVVLMGLWLVVVLAAGTWMARPQAMSPWAPAYELAELHSNAILEHGVWLIALPFSVLLLGLIKREHLGGRPLLTWLNGLGDMSYSLYLVHGFVIYALLGRPSLERLLATQQWTVLGVMACALVVAYMAHRVVERPVTAWLRQRWLR